MNQFHQIEISSIHGWAPFVPHVPRLICRKVCCCVKNVCVWWWVVGDSELCANSAPVWKHCWVAHTGTGISVEGGQTEKNPGNLPTKFVCVCVSAELANIYSSIIHETKLRCWTFLLVALTHTQSHRRGNLFVGGCEPIYGMMMPVNSEREREMEYWAPDWVTRRCASKIQLSENSRFFRDVVA